MITLTEAACAVMQAAQADDKVALTRRAAQAWRTGEITELGATLPPDRPARPDRPELLPPNKMPKRSFGGAQGRLGLMHALAHIELNAIDLAWDIAARFTHEDMPRAFYDDWVQVALDEAEHFAMLRGVLQGLGSDYGALPAHDGLWQAAMKTAHDLRARLAVVPMTLEARGLDTTPATLEKLRRNGDTLSIPVLEKIYVEEIPHVAAGARWFIWLSERLGEDPTQAFHRIHRENFPGGLKAPFNHEARQMAGFPKDFYEPLAA